MLRPLLLPRSDSYFAREFLLMCLAVFFGMVALIIIGDAFQQADEFTDYAQKSGVGVVTVLLMLLNYYAAFAPVIVLQWLMPLVMLLAAVIVITKSSNYNEYTVLRASGISLQRAALPFLFVALAISYVSSLTRDLYLPHLIRRKAAISNRIRPRSKRPVKVALRDGETFHIVAMGHFDSKAGTAHNLRIEIRRLDDFYNGENTYDVYAAHSAALQPAAEANDEHRNQWTPEKGARHLVQGKWQRLLAAWEEPVPTLVTRAMLERHALGMAIMTWNDLNRLAEDLDVRMEREKRRAEPWMTPLILLVAFPLILRAISRGEEPNYILNVLAGTAVCGAFYVLQMVFEGWGEQEWIRPMVAAWLPHLIFVGVGVWVYPRIEQ